MRRHLEGEGSRGIATTPYPARRKVAAVRDIKCSHLVMLRSVGDAETGSSTTTTSTLRVGTDPNFGNPNRVLLLVDLNTVPEHQPIGHGVAVGDPTVDLRAGGATLRAEEFLVDIGLVILAPVDARDDGIAGTDPTRPFGEPVAVPGIRECFLRSHHEPLSDIGGGHRARVGKSWDADHAILAQANIDAAKRTGIVGNIGIDAVEDSGHDVVHGAGSRFVDSSRHTVDVVGEVDIDHPSRRVDTNLDVDRDPVWQRAEWIMPAVPNDRSLRHLRN